MRLLPQWDVSNTMIGLLCFCLLTARTVRSTVRHRAPGVWALAAGALGGLLLLLNPATAFVMGPSLIWLFVRDRESRRSAPRYCAIAAVAAALCVAP
jgi:4-amino-4-deoxy-L-arabinose transferase-like glycosyltransferase